MARTSFWVRLTTLIHEWRDGRQASCLLARVAMRPPLTGTIPEIRQPWEGKSMSQFNRAFRQVANERGQTMAEYVLILSSIAVVLLGLLENFGTVIATLVGRVDPLL